MRLIKTQNILTLDPLSNEEICYPNRVGYFSGTFDPFHLGHRRALQLALPYLDEILVQPHNFNPKKKPIDIAHRKAMVLLSLQGLDRVYLLDYPQELSQDKYVLMNDLENTLQGISLVDIIGQDHLRRTIDHGIERDVICLQRKGQPLILHSRILYLQNDLDSISSSKIRKKLREKESNLPLSKSVLDYISQNRLYQ